MPPTAKAPAATVNPIARPKNRHIGQVPVLVIRCITVRPAWPAGETQAGLWGSLLPAAWSYMLACRAWELGTAWTTQHLQYETEIAALLGVPGGIREGALIPTAYYTDDTFRPRCAPAASGRAARRSLVTAIADLGEPYAPGGCGQRT